jgi:hypothetical protein
MLGNEADKEINIASGNKAISDNKLSLFNIEMDFSGLKDAIALFFPDFRHEMILRYRAETSAKILLEAKRLAQNEKIQINPIPPKIANSIFEKMSLEHEEDMYEKWAKLLVAAGVKPNPIQQQYAEILSNLNSLSANLLKEIYNNQTDSSLEFGFENYIDSLRFEEQFKHINNEIKLQNMRRNEKQELLPDTRIAFIRFPYTVNVSEKHGDEYPISANELKNILMGLERLGLIKYKSLIYKRKKDENNEYINIHRYEVLLTQFGFSFVDCLENSKEKDNI